MYQCTACGYKSVSWYGKCPECNGWNTLEKDPTAPAKGKKGKRFAASVEGADFKPLKKLGSLSSQRLSTHVHEFDRVLGGGFVSGEVVLLAGEPGVGKSTILLKLLSQYRTRYVSGEESGEQIKQRAERLGVDIDNITFSQNIVVESIIKALQGDSKNFDIVVIDSIQTVYSAEGTSSIGSVSQIKESANKLTDFAKQYNKIVLIVGHVTKGGDIAGPKTLEHLVDCVLYLEGEKQSHFRILRSQKNRFGPTDEVGLFEMAQDGLNEVDEPTAFLDETHDGSPGRSTIATVEGSRALFYEIQSLVVPTSLAIPRRVVSGIDYNRLQLLLAVMRKYLNIKLDQYDIYVNVVGGVTAKSPSADLGIVASVLSSIKNKPLPNKAVFTGEIGLLGELRSGLGQEKAIKDALRLGFKKVYSPKNTKSVKQLKRIYG